MLEKTTLVLTNELTCIQGHRGQKCNASRLGFQVHRARASAGANWPSFIEVNGATHAYSSKGCWPIDLHKGGCWSGVELLRCVYTSKKRPVAWARSTGLGSGCRAEYCSGSLDSETPWGSSPSLNIHTAIFSLTARALQAQLDSPGLWDSLAWDFSCSVDVTLGSMV